MKETAAMSNALRGLVGLIVIGAAVSALSGKTTMLHRMMPSAAANAAPGWRDIQAPIGKVLDLQSRLPGLPPTAWFVQSQKSVAGDIDGLLDEAVGILGVSGADNDRHYLRDLQAQAKDLQERIAAWRIERTGLPQEGSLFVRAQGDCDRDIAGAEAEIARLDAQMALLRKSFEQRLAAIGIAGGPAYADALLASVTGHDVIEVNAVLVNLKRINADLLDAMRRSGESLETARRYYGIHQVLLRIVVHLQQTVIQRTEQLYLPKIERIAGQANGLRVRAKELLARETNPGQKKVLDANAAAQDLTLRAAELYRRYLLAQRDTLAAALARTQRQLAVSENTFETVKLSADLAAMLSRSGAEFATVLAATVPPLEPFQNAEIRAAIEKLTIRLQEPGV
jgi:hypothetical protein